jgi:hypothetical protein
VTEERPETPEDRQSRRGGPLPDPATIGGVARLAAGAWWRTNKWAAQTAVEATRRAAQAARSGESPVALLEEAGRQVVRTARDVLGVAELERRLGPASEDADEREELRRRWEELIERSASVDDEDAHPAFPYLFNNLAPDEARILRLLAIEGPQAAVDVRTWRPLGIGSTVVAPGLTMIGQRAGCRALDRVPVYLSNLYRLGLIWFSRDPIDDLAAYQVLEAQPEVLEALERAGRGTTVRRSIRLTPFGEQFVAAALPSEGTAATVDDDG